jgi:cytochrome c oxidase cbb3-type subunit 3
MSDDKKQIKPGHDYETTGHSWDGIEEYNKPLPKWWLYTFYICIIWGIGYTIAYPAWPGIKAATPGLLGFSTRAQVAEEIAEMEAKNASINEELAAADLVELAAADDDLHRYANNAGAAIFRSWCSQCHGSGAAGNPGYPNLLDDDWLWGGTVEDIHTTVSTGIRQLTDEDWLRQSQMPAFGRDELLEEGDINAVVNYVMDLSGNTPRDASVVEEGSVIFADNCASCHGEDGTGDRTQGAPNLTDAIWLYGGDYDTLHDTVYNARYGQMPAMGGAELEDWEINAVVTYVHGLGGGEASE